MARFCADKGFAHQTLQRWAAKLRHETAATPAPVGLARVVRPGSNGHVVLEIEGVRVLVDERTDMGLLATVVFALRAPR